MAMKAGVWIDHKQAVVVLVNDAGREIKKITSGAQASGRPTRASRSKHSYTRNAFVAEDRLERKTVGHRNKYYDEVIACLRGAEAILIFGPGEAKGEFSNRIKSKKIRGRLVELETADKMTERQIAAKVSQHFAPTTSSKSAASKKTEKAKTPVAASAKRAKTRNK